MLGFTIDPIVDASMSAFSQEISQTFCVLKSITPAANGVFGTTTTTIDVSSYFTTNCDNIAGQPYTKATITYSYSCQVTSLV